MTDLATALERVLDARITDLRRLTGGASRTTWAFTARTGAGDRRLILRTGPPDEVHAGMELEARAQELAAAQGAPVPDILAASNSAESLGNPYLICGEIAGETIVRKIARNLDDAGRARLLTQCAAALAAIHRADPADAELTAEDQLSAWRDELDTMDDTTATFEWAFRWLERNRPAPTTPTLVHGDFRMGNLIVDMEGGFHLAAVLDWELVHAGDPREDLAWFCIRAWRFGAPKALSAGGLGSIEDFLSAYGDAGGVRVDPGEFRWWLVLATLRWGVICRYQAERHLSGQTRSVELATIGRRVCETEWDLLNLLEHRRVDEPPRHQAARSQPIEHRRADEPPRHQAARHEAARNRPIRHRRADEPPRHKAVMNEGATHGAARSEAARSRPIRHRRADEPPRHKAARNEPVEPMTTHGRPTAAELVGAVADFLDTDVRGVTEGQVNFHARVAANALRMVVRELEATDTGTLTAALAALGAPDEAELAAAIRRGDFDDRAEELPGCLRALVSHRLTAAHPGYEQE